MTIQSKPLPSGTARIRARDLATVAMTPSGWKLSEPGFPDARHKADDYVFSHDSDPRRPLDGKDIKKAIKTYCGKEFYPHYIRPEYVERLHRYYL